MNDRSSLSTFRIAHWIGYGLFVLALFNLLETVIPLNLLNPAWEFQTIGTLVEQVPILLVGLGLIFLGDRFEPSRSEVTVLKLISWFALLMGILYFLFIPLTVVNTVRLDRQNNQELTAQLDQRVAIVQQVKAALAQVKTIEEMQALLSQLHSIGVAPEIQATGELQPIKDQVTQFLDQGEARLKTQVEETRSGQRLNLLKKSLKWCLGGLVAGFLLITVWRNTGDIRRS